MKQDMTNTIEEKGNNQTAERLDRTAIVLLAMWVHETVSGARDIVHGKVNWRRCDAAMKHADIERCQ